VEQAVLTSAGMRSTVQQVACGPGAPVTLKPLRRVYVRAGRPAHETIDRSIGRSAGAPVLLSESQEVTADEDGKHCNDYNIDDD
jgi:hypothetical protein